MEKEHAPTLRGDALSLWLLMRVWLPFACGYFLSYFYRTINAMISPDLVRDLEINPSQLGLLTSAYFLSFGLFQLPLGMLLDRYGPRRVNASLLLIAATGAAIFATAQSMPGLSLARSLIGLGVSACLMASIKAFVLWFPMSRLASLNGWLLAAGGVGAMTATAPVEAALAFTDWRGVFLGISAATLAASALVFFLVPERSEATSRESLAQLLAGMRTVFGNAFFWRLSLLLMFVQGAFLSMQGLWAAPWLRDMAGMERTEVAHTLLAMAVAITLGFAMLGTVADRLTRYGVDAMTIFKFTIGVSIVMLMLVVVGVRTGVTAVWVVFSFSGTGSVLVYAILSKHFPKELAGRVNTAANLLVFIGAFATQWGIGAVVNLWPASTGQYAAEGYRAAFGALLLLQCVAFAYVVVGKDR